MRFTLYYHWVAVFLFCFLVIKNTEAQQTVQVDKHTQEIQLDEYLLVVEDPDHSLTPQQLLERSSLEKFKPYTSFSQPLHPTSAYWGILSVKANLADTSDWILNIYNNGFVDAFLLMNDGTLLHKKAGKYQKDSEKDITRGHHPYIGITLPPQSHQTLLFKVREIDHLAPQLTSQLVKRSYWQTWEVDRLFGIVMFFEGIFWVIVLYNLILFFSIRYKAYLYYALYLTCVAIFVLVAVGPLQSPPFGDPVWHQQAGYLAFGAINVFYFLFGRSFLDTRTLIPHWDKWLSGYIIFKIVVLLILQVIITLTFNLRDILTIEFGMFFFDNLLSIALFVVLFRTKSILARFFIAGSSAVMIIGLSLAVIGHIVSIPYSFVIFLVTIVVEIIFFSLGLGYKIRQSEREKLDAEKEKRKAQEALNAELSKINTAFGRFVPHEFLRSLGKDTVLDVQLGDQVEKEVTVFFSDIRSYTTLSEQMTPKENFDFLNAYLGRVGPLIKSNHGFVNQYYGDGIMAIFMGATDNALKASISIHQELVIYNQHRVGRGRTPIHIGIGLHSGSLMMGVIGDTLRMDTGVVSDTVNTASRMEGLTKHFPSLIVASEDVVDKLEAPESFHIRYLGQVQVKGRADPIRIYDVFDADPEKIKRLKASTKSPFEEGLRYYADKKFPKAIQLFRQVLNQNPEDLVARLYIERSEKYLLEGVDENWTGIEQLLLK